MALIASAVAFVVGCTGGPIPIVTETPTPVSTPAQSPSPSPSPSPDADVTAEELHAEIGGAAASPDLQGAIATAIYFMEARPYLFKDHDFRYWDALSLAGCNFCVSVVESVEEVMREEWQFSGGITAVVDESIEGGIEDGTGDAYIGFTLEEEPIVVTDASGKVVFESDHDSYSVSVGLRHVDGVWRIIGVGIE